MKKLKLSLTVALLLSGQVFADAGDSAKKLANPLAAMISLPIQANYQPNMGADDQGSQ